jgi:hypothetical protein
MEAITNATNVNFLQRVDICYVDTLNWIMGNLLVNLMAIVIQNSNSLKHLMSAKRMVQRKMASQKMYQQYLSLSADPEIDFSFQSTASSRISLKDMSPLHF